ncbi:NAD(+) synthase [Pontibacter sp. G13]|uniref:NAD(+) synthase n=1 Tax=Pontibacter sp. G13 TaxID=3074898 RepID=UPI00288BCF01|nr:NAD(+) synthase [Pontibacter sp. G13]WNJ18930.1 NAD(+) synthase [Pontibacter sp. G13]
MKLIRIAGGCLNQTPMDFGGNVRNILDAIEEAKARSVQLLCLPELAISGYGCEDTFFSDYLLQSSLEGLSQIIPHTEGLTVTVGLPMEYEHCLYNVVAVIHDARLVGFVAKQELAGDGIYYEPRWFKPWHEGAIVALPWADSQYPFGDLIFEIGGVRFGFEICEDAWNGIRPAQRHYLHNVDVILNPSASNFAFGKGQTRERLVTETSRAYNCTYIYSNLLGNEAGRIIYDGEILIAQDGELLARNRRFSYDDFQIMDVDIDVEKIHIRRKKSFNFDPVFPEHLVQLPDLYEESVPPYRTGDIAPLETKEEEFYMAETLGLFDYMRKSRSRGFVLSLSGGADSSTCCVLCAESLMRASRELGRERLIQKLGYMDFEEGKSLMSQLLTCVYQGTRNSGPETLESAMQLTDGVGGTFHEWNVEDLRKTYVSLATSAMGRELTWDRDDLALQNIQARLRAPGIWMLANLKGALLLTTSNRSEAAVGYATMDGDTSGGLAPLGGVDKDFILQWLQWAEKSLDIPELGYVNALKPTAELRPSDYDQTDEADLMPYGVLDDIEKCAIRDYKSPLEVFKTLRGSYPDKQLTGYIRKFFLLWSRNQWKRERYAPSFHLDDENLDPKTWCRFPILNGGYWAALEEMDHYANETFLAAPADGESY